MMLGKFDTRDELEKQVGIYYKRGDTLRSIGVKCEISFRSVRCIVRKHGWDKEFPRTNTKIEVAAPKVEFKPGELRFVRSPCWRAYCDDPKCIHHQEVSHVR